MTASLQQEARAMTNVVRDFCNRLQACVEGDWRDEKSHFDRVQCRRIPEGDIRAWPFRRWIFCKS